MASTIQDVEITADSIRKVKCDIKNYYWMSRQITPSDVTEYLNSMTAQYGIESVMPKPQGSTGDVVYGAVQSHERAEKRRIRMARTVKRLENGVEQLKDEQERFVIEDMMDRVTFANIGRSLSITRQAVFEIKERAVQHLAAIMYLA